MTVTAIGTCSECGDEFERRTSGKGGRPRRYCSNTCNKRAWRRRKTEPPGQHIWKGIWAAWCDHCRVEIGPRSHDNSCPQCDRDLSDAPQRGPYDPSLTPELARALLDKAKAA